MRNPESGGGDGDNDAVVVESPVGEQRQGSDGVVVRECCGANEEVGVVGEVQVEVMFVRVMEPLRDRSLWLIVSISV